jgi:hypothetical protein
MTVANIAYIASKGNLKLFSLGNYQYQICKFTNGNVNTVKNLYGYDLDRALDTLKAMG